MSEPLIKLKNLCKTYVNEGVMTQAVCGVSFVINRGEFVSIVGPSGSGKSTLMQILGFLDRATGGEYYFEGKEISGFSDEELAAIRNKKVGFVFQSFNLLSRFTVFENIQMPMYYDSEKQSSEEIKRRVEAALNAVGMLSRMNYKANQLSGGEKQRVAIARALIMEPDVIFADEPTGNLDSKNGAQVMKILQNLHKQGKTIILVTHETGTAHYAERIITVKDGNIVGDERIEQRMVGEDGTGLK